MVQLSTTRCSLVSFATITLCVASQLVFVVVVVVDFVINSVRKLLDTRSYTHEGRLKSVWTDDSAPLLCRGRR
jgi:hypothetical protein